MKKTNRNKIATRALPVILALTLGVVVAFAVFTLYSTNRSVENYKWVNHTHSVMSNLERLYTAMLKAESAQRGYILTGDRTLYAPFVGAKNDVIKSFNRAYSLIEGNQLQRRRLDTIHTLIQERLDNLEYVSKVDSMSVSSSDFVRDLVVEGDIAMNRLREYLEKMEADEDRMLTLRTQDFENSYTRVYIVQSLFSLVTILITVFSFLYLSNEWRKRRKVQKKMEAANQKLQGLFNNTFQFMGFLEPDGTVVDINKPALDFAGVTMEDIRGKKFWDCPWWEGSEKVKFTMKKSLEQAGQGKFVRYEEEFYGKNDACLIIDFSLKPIYGPEGKVEYILPEGRDVTELHEAQEKILSSQKILLAAEGIAEFGSWSMDFETKKIEFTEGAYHICGISPGDELDLKTLINMTHPEEKERLQSLVEHSMASFEDFETEFRMFSMDGKLKEVFVKTSVQNNVYGEPESYIGVIQDISTVKQKERALEASAQELQRSNEELEQFAYVASHDLQEPLRKIRAFGDRLMTKFEGTALPGKEYVDRMQDAASRMQTLIDDLLTFSRVSRTNIEKQKVDLNKVVFNVLDDLQTSIAEKGAQVLATSLPTVLANETQMRQLFQNLISNGLKFTKPDQEPEIHIEARKAHKQEVEKMNLNLEPLQKGYHVITVKDNGIGFDQRYADKIFTLFQRLHGRSEYRGTGIGLAVCKKIVENSGGMIFATGKQGKGAMFHIYLPIQ